MYTCIALRALKVSYSDVGEGGFAVNCKKNTIFPEQPVHLSVSNIICAKKYPPLVRYPPEFAYIELRKLTDPEILLRNFRRRFEMID